MEHLSKLLPSHQYTRLPTTNRLDPSTPWIKPPTSRTRQLLLVGAALSGVLVLVSLFSIHRSGIPSLPVHAAATTNASLPLNSGPHPDLSLPLPPAFVLHRPPRVSVGEDQHAMNQTLQRAFSLTQHSRPACNITERHHERYSILKEGVDRRNIFLAMNLINNANVFPNIMQEMPRLLRFLGPQRVHLSIYENGSEDETPQFLIMLAQALDALGTSYTIVSRGKEDHPDKGFNHRIEVLSAVRNAAMAPLYEGIIGKYMPGKKGFDEVLVMNDVIFCTVDVLEVLYQKLKRGAVSSCSVDWDWNGRIVYDRWVLRDMAGNPWYEHDNLVKYFHDPRPLDEKDHPTPLPLDEAGRERFLSLRPMQVFSCWNGMAAFSASVFLEHGIRFRGGHSDHWPDGKVKEPSDIVSECYLTSVDMWKQGIGKIVLASRARVAYSVSDYEIYRVDGKIGQLGQTAYEALDAQEQFEWKTTPPATVRMHDFAWWENPERVAPWDEP